MHWPSPPLIAYPPPSFTFAACRGLFLSALNEARGSPLAARQFLRGKTTHQLEASHPPSLALYLHLEERRPGFDTLCLEGARRPLKMWEGHQDMTLSANPASLKGLWETTYRS